MYFNLWYKGNWWWTGRPGLLQFMGSQRVGHDWATELNLLIKGIITDNQRKISLCIYFTTSQVKNPPANAGDSRDKTSITRSRRSHETRNGRPLQYSCLENSLDRDRGTIYRTTNSCGPRVNHNWAIEHICFIVDVFFPESTIIDSCLFQQFEEMQMFTYKQDPTI